MLFLLCESVGVMASCGDFDENPQFYILLFHFPTAIIFSPSNCGYFLTFQLRLFFHLPILCYSCYASMQEFRRELASFFKNLLTLGGCFGWGVVGFVVVVFWDS
jgi:hypothetical protein